MVTERVDDSGKFDPALFRRCQEVMNELSKSSFTHQDRKENIRIGKDILSHVFFSQDLNNPFSICSRFFRSKGNRIPTFADMSEFGLLENSYPPEDIPIMDSKRKLMEAGLQHPDQLKVCALAVFLSQPSLNGSAQSFISYLVGDSPDASMPNSRDMVTLAGRGVYREASSGTDAHSERYISMIVDCLKLEKSGSVIIVADSGTGKTALVERLADKIYRRDASVESLLDYSIWEIDIIGILSGTAYRGEFENKFRRVIESIKKKGKSIAFFDQMQMLAGAGKTSDSSIDAISMLTEPLIKGLKVIGTVTREDFNIHLSKYPSFTRQFQIVYYDEPPYESVVQIVTNRVKVMENVTTDKSKASPGDVFFSREYLLYAIKNGTRHIRHLSNPFKSISLIERSIIKARTIGRSFVTKNDITQSIYLMCNIVLPEEGRVPLGLSDEMQLDPPDVNKLSASDIYSSIDASSSPVDPFSSWSVHGGSVLAMNSINSSMFGTQSNSMSDDVDSDSDSIELIPRRRDRAALKHMISEQSNRPKKNHIVQRPPKEKQRTHPDREYEPLIPISRLNSLSKHVKNHVKGQNRAIESISLAIASSQISRDENIKSPFLSVLISGLSGTGKTLLCRKIAEHLLGREECFLCLNMGDYKEPSSLSGIIASPDKVNSGKLSTHIKQYPYSIVLLDEFEKSHTSIQDYFLSVFDTGTSYDDAGKKMDFTTTIFILTTNIGADDFLSRYEKDLMMYRKGFHSDENELASASSSLIALSTRSTSHTNKKRKIEDSENSDTTDNESETYDNYSLNTRDDPYPTSVYSTLEYLQRCLDEFSSNKSSMRLELVGRINRVITYGIPDNQSVMGIIRHSIESLIGILKDRYPSFDIQVANIESLCAHVIRNGYSDKEGIRSIQRFIGNNIQDKLSEVIVSNFDGGAISILIGDDATIRTQD